MYGPLARTLIILKLGHEVYVILLKGYLYPLSRPFSKRDCMILTETQSIMSVIKNVTSLLDIPIFISFLFNA